MAKKAINEFNENEKVRPIVIHDAENGRDYTLEFDLESVRFAQARGFDSDDIGKFPVIKTEELFYYAFRKNQSNGRNSCNGGIVAKSIYHGYAGCGEGQAVDAYGLL